jgi:hypothetical protein
MMVACEPAAEFPAGMVEVEGNHVVSPDPGSSFSASTEIPEIEIEACEDDLACLTDESCDVWGGCDANPCTDDRCVAGRCALMGVASCDPDYVLEYSVSACCPTRHLGISPDGRVTYQVEGEDPVITDFLSPLYLHGTIDRAGAAGFFGWSEGRCVPGESAADFSLTMSDGESTNTVSCTQGVCVGQLCHVLDSVWAVMPPNWYDGCGCS